MSSRRLACAACAFAALAATCPASARDRPGTPTDLATKPNGPTSLILQFTNTAAGGERVIFEVEMTRNGNRVDPDRERALSSRFPATKLRGNVLSARVDGLTPGDEYCFRVWSRRMLGVHTIFESSNIRSEHPSAWHCAKTLPNPPLAPLNVAVRAGPTLTTKAPRVSWRAPDQSNWRGIDEYTIVRRDLSDPKAPWTLDVRVGGPRAPRNRVDYDEAASVPPRDGRYAYRVCSVNAGGTTCSKDVEVALSVNPPVAGAHANAAKASELATKAARASTPLVDAATPTTKHARAATTAPKPPPATAATPKWTPPVPSPAPTATPAPGTWTRAQPPAAVGNAGTTAPASSLSR